MSVPMPLSLPTYRVAGMQVIKVYEVLDIANAPRVNGELAALVRTGCDPSVVVDLRTPYLTTAGIEVLEHAGQVAARRRRSLRIAAHRSLARRVLRITGADQVLEVHPDLSSALCRPST